jgi:6-phosphogluconolactonase
MAVRVFDSPGRLAEFGAGWIAERIARGREERGRFDLALPGGRSPVGLLHALAATDRLGTDDWARVHLWFADERAVPPDDPASNLRLVLEALAEGAVPSRAAPRPEVHPMRGDAPDLEVAAREYDASLPPALDLVVLGIGEDGHVASLFPGSRLLGERVRRVAVVLDSPKPPPRRLTLTPRALDEAREVVVLGIGAEKAAAVARALEGDVTPATLPARLLRGRAWWLDRAAARRVAPED